jgi:hypothetical protein
MRAALCLLALALPFATAGCLDYSEDVHLNANGTGTFVMAWGAPEEAFEEPGEVEGITETLKEVAEQFKQHPEVTATEVKQWAKGGKQHFSLAIDTKSWEAIPTLFDAAEDSVLCSDGQGPIQLTKLEGTRVRFVRVLSDAEESRVRVRAGTLWTKVKGQTNAAPQASLPTAADERSFDFTFRVHAPKVVSATGLISGGTASWTFPFDDFADNDGIPAQLTAELDTAGSSWLFPIAALAGLGLGFCWLKKKWDKRAA